MPAFAPPPAFDPWLTYTVGLDVVSATRAHPTAQAQRRERRLAELLRVACRSSAYYRHTIGGMLGGVPPPESLPDLPITHKRELMAQFEAWVTDPALKLAELQAFMQDPARIGTACPGGYVVWQSSGSSGEPAVFVQDARSMAAYDALDAWRRPALKPPPHWWNPWFAGERTAFVGAIGGHFASIVSIERWRRLNPLLAHAIRNVSFLQPAQDVAAQVDDFAPQVIATYPSAAVLLAHEAAAGQLRTRPQEIWTGGEALTPAMRTFCEATLGCRLTASYGASEFLSMASECSHGALHLNADWVIFESVDEQYRPVPEGTAGHTTLLTNLANHVQPLIRYDLGDSVRYAPQPCACGCPLPTIEVQGRIDDVLLLKNARGKPVTLLPLALVTVLEDDAGVFDFQLVQDGAASLALNLAPHAGRAGLQAARRALAAYLKIQGLGNVTLNGQLAEPSRYGASGKAQRIMHGTRPLRTRRCVPSGCMPAR
jgi:phenylacetate-CoA ligase